MNDVASVLRHEFERRSEKNPNYSMRAFARDAGIVQSRMSEILRAKQGLSQTAARCIGERLKLPEDLIAEFCDLAAMAYSRSQIQRALARQRLELREIRRKELALDPEQLRLVATWECLAILELTRVKGFRLETDWISERLGIAQRAVSEALETVRAVGLLEEDGTVRRQTVRFIGA